MKRLVLISLLGIVGFGIVGCGPADGKKIRDLNQNQSERLCEDLSESLESCDNLEIAADCEDYYDDYISNLSDSCDATVGQTKSCMDSCGQNTDSCEELDGC